MPALFLFEQARLQVFLFKLPKIGLPQRMQGVSFLQETPKQVMLQKTCPPFCFI
jgi:hypothetical protein